MTEQELQALMDGQTQRLRQERPRFTWRVWYAPPQFFGFQVDAFVIVDGATHDQRSSHLTLRAWEAVRTSARHEAIIDALADEVEQRLVASQRTLAGRERASDAVVADPTPPPARTREHGISPQQARQWVRSVSRQQATSPDVGERTQGKDLTAAMDRLIDEHEQPDAYRKKMPPHGRSLLWPSAPSSPASDEPVSTDRDV